MKKTLDFQIEDSINCLNFINPELAILFTTSGQILLYNTTTHTRINVMTNPGFRKYTCGNLDSSQPATIYVHDEIFVIANDFGDVARVVNIRKKYIYDFQRGDYQLQHCKYPIVLFNRKQKCYIGTTTAWNSMHIIDLQEIENLFDANMGTDAMQQLPLDVDNDENDYFWGQLSISSDNQYILCRGWDWGSIDSLKVIDVEMYPNAPKEAETRIGTMLEHLNRPACFIDKKNVAFLYREKEEGWIDVQSPTNQDEIHIYSHSGQFIEKITLDREVYSLESEMIYIDQQFVFYSSSHIQYYSKLGAHLSCTVINSNKIYSSILHAIVSSLDQSVTIYPIEYVNPNEITFE